ncbi:hypothetical protein Tsubulata_014937 [Turnera subulata]|uniref:DUF4283 domain-containing protein n=1 Tax=Turnera subulata TaxID=218843 RepID=A0A9Q0FN44_9ROSI|nr:hypothetical protein Tsubulata_014937 [Turnera subulata]
MFLFQFPTDASLSYALNGGPWHVSGIPLILRVWDSNLQKLDVSSPVLPVWLLVNLHGEICSIGVQYSWKPQHCDSCNQWGHHQLACSSNRPPVKQWIPKATAIRLAEPIVSKIVVPAPLQSASLPTQPSVAVSPKDALSNVPIPSQIPKIPTVPAGANLNHSTACATVSVASSSATSPINVTDVPSSPNIPAVADRNAPVASVGIADAKPQRHVVAEAMAVAMAAVAFNENHVVDKWDLLPPGPETAPMEITRWLASVVQTEEPQHHVVGEAMVVAVAVAAVAISNDVPCSRQRIL